MTKDTDVVLVDENDGDDDVVVLEIMINDGDMRIAL